MVTCVNVICKAGHKVTHSSVIELFFSPSTLTIVRLSLSLSREIEPDERWCLEPTKVPLK